ncbi:hypothetical protein AFEL58S_02071 [Afipia felis]
MSAPAAFIRMHYDRPAANACQDRSKLRAVTSEGGKETEPERELPRSGSGSGAVLRQGRAS